jgi:hypothetical protein
MTAFVLGNGVSRLEVPIDTLKKLGDVYGCNALYRTHVPTALVATDQHIAREIQESGYSKHNRFYTRRPLPKLGAHAVPREYFGYSSGPIAVGLAAVDRHLAVYLIGFDMGPNTNNRFNNVYADTEFYRKSSSLPTYTGNWVRQIVTICRDFPKTSFHRVMGETTAAIPEFSNINNLRHMPITDFLDRINNTKDL